MASGPFAPDMASLEQYHAPDWFRDAKFGIWAHWGPQAVPRAGDWYARQMYIPGHPHYDHHLKTYGHPSEVGYKDIIPLWKAEKFDPEALMDKYVAAGAKYFVSMGVHHDNFDLWNSKTHRWNAVAMGPKRDIVGAWKAAAKKRGLRFGVSEHLGASHNWFYPSHLYDQMWPKLGVNYDGADPRFADLYHANKGEPYRSTETWYTRDPAYHQIWFDRIRDLIDNYQPDLLYSDGGLPFGIVGRSLLSHFYNSATDKTGRTQAVYNCKAFGSGEYSNKMCVQDVERGVLKGINPLPWQTDTSNGDWFYSDNYTYKTAPDVIHMLADIVSKNGNLLLNIVLYPDGSLPPNRKACSMNLRPGCRSTAKRSTARARGKSMAKARPKPRMAPSWRTIPIRVRISASRQKAIRFTPLRSAIRARHAGLLHSAARREISNVRSARCNSSDRRNPSLFSKLTTLLWWPCRRPCRHDTAAC